MEFEDDLPEDEGMPAAPAPPPGRPPKEAGGRGRRGEAERRAAPAAGPTEDDYGGGPAGGGGGLALQRFADRGVLRVEVEYHTLANSFHTDYAVARYAEVAEKFRLALTEALTEAGLDHEVRLNSGPPKGYDPYHNIQGWYQHGRSAQNRLRSRWASRPLKKVIYPRLGAFEVSVRLPLRQEGSPWRGLPREFVVFSKLKRKVWPREDELAHWLARQLALVQGGDAEAVAELLAASGGPVQCGEDGEEGTVRAIDDPCRYRRPVRNPPMWLSLMPRGSPPPPTMPGRPASRAGSAARGGGALPMIEAGHARVDPAQVEKLRLRLKGAAYSISGPNWHKLFHVQDRDGSGHINWPEFRVLCRRIFSLNGEDCHLRALFSGLEVDHSGMVPIQELVAFVQDPLGRVRARLWSGARSRSEEGEDWLSLVEAQTADCAGQVDFPAFRTLCRRTLGVVESDDQLRLVFRHLDAEGLGEVALEDLVDFIAAAATAPEYEEQERPRSQPTPLPPASPPPPSRATTASRAASSRASRATSASPWPGDLHSSLERMRSRLKGAAYTLAGQDWRKLFQEHGMEGHGVFDWVRFQQLCRRGLRMSDEDDMLRMVFAHLDVQGSGEVGMEDLIDFVAPAAVSVEACMELLGKADWARRQQRVEVH